MGGRRSILGTITVLTLSVLSLSAPAAAQDDAIATGLNSPRKLFYDRDGALYIAEAGKGGAIDGQGPYGPIAVGLSGQVTVVSPDGEQSVLIPNLVSIDDRQGTINGPDAIYMTDESYWVVLGTGPVDPPPGANVEAVVEVDRESLEVKQVIDLRAFEEANNPDTDVQVVSNPIDLVIADDGMLYIADASGNDLMTWTADGGLKLFTAWPVDSQGNEPSAVPTAVDIGPDGDIYVGFLPGYPYPTGGARIERYSADGELKETYGGLTLVTDILVTDDGVIYAVEMSSGFGDLGFAPNAGRIVQVSDEGLTPVMSGLNFPFGLAQDADGNMVVTANSAYSEPDAGMVIPVVMGGAAPAATPAAATTPEVATTPETG